jgi:hypothetical protein
LTEVHGKGTVEATECQENIQLLVFQNIPARAGLLSWLQTTLCVYDKAFLYI